MDSWIKYINVNYDNDEFRDDLEIYCNSGEFQYDIDDLNGDWKKAIDNYYENI